MKKILITISACLVSSAIYASDDLERQTTENLPAIGLQKEIYPGDTLITEETGIYKDCMVPKFSFEKHYLSVVAGKPICREPLTEDRYFPTYPNDNTRSDGAPEK